MMHGGLDNGGGLISFHRVSGFFFLNFNCAKSQCWGLSLPEYRSAHAMCTIIFLGIQSLLTSLTQCFFTEGLLFEY